MMTLSAGLFVLAAQVVLPEPNREEPLAGKLSLTLTSAQNTYYVGETVRLQLELRNFSDSPVLGWFTLESSMKTTIYHRHGGTTFRPLAHLDARRYGPQRWVRLDPGARLTHQIAVAFDPATQLPLLNELGDYDFQVEYRDFDSPNGVLLSNILGVSVIDVPADQREALAAYRQGLAFFAEFDPGRPHTVTPAQIQAGASFLQRFQGSLYWKDVLSGVWKAVAERVFSNVASDSEQALLKKIREEWADSTPPTLSLSATPSSLWPPNHKLVPVTVTVNVTDDQDPGPDVKLVSITCDDGCSPVQDIAGATLNTDDRDFELRAERLGTGTGRTYTVTYEASDSAGNKATAATTVTVPHDQGKKK